MTYISDLLGSQLLKMEHNTSGYWLLAGTSPMFQITSPAVDLHTELGSHAWNGEQRIKKAWCI